MTGCRIRTVCFKGTDCKVVFDKRLTAYKGVVPLNKRDAMINRVMHYLNDVQNDIDVIAAVIWRKNGKEPEYTYSTIKPAQAALVATIFNQVAIDVYEEKIEGGN